MAPVHDILDDIGLIAIQAETRLIAAIKSSTSPASSSFVPKWNIILVSMTGVPAGNTLFGLTCLDVRGRGQTDGVTIARLSSYRVVGNCRKMRSVYGSHDVCAISHCVLIRTLPICLSLHAELCEIPHVRDNLSSCTLGVSLQYTSTSSYPCLA